MVAVVVGGGCFLCALCVVFRARYAVVFHAHYAAATAVISGCCGCCGVIMNVLRIAQQQR